MTSHFPPGPSADTDADNPPVRSFEDYVRARSDGLTRMACLVTRDWDEARDAVQDALVGLYPRWATLPEQRLDAYVHRSVINACLIRLRRRRRVLPVAEPHRLPDELAFGDPAAGVALADLAWRLCSELPPLQRAAVVLRFYRDLSYADVAEALGCSESTARSHVHRALAALRTRYQEGENHG
ncbi:MAG: sigma-70 family RNA polymerase sigma factor [Micropruina sp.]|uniref:sigma-70 family RNA polymerase sigma factor n=1 Tax=Micropruina sp. TaxID=2737536 RepID=UPI0039E3D1B4